MEAHLMLSDAKIDRLIVWIEKMSDHLIYDSKPLPKKHPNCNLCELVDSASYSRKEQ